MPETRIAALVALSLLAVACEQPPAARAPEPVEAREVPSTALSAPERIELRSDGLVLQAMLYRPASVERAPVVVYNHGSERDPGIEWLGTTAAFFQRNGFVVVLPYRRGASGSEGTYWRDEVDRQPEAEQDRSTIVQLDLENADVAAAVRWAREQPFVDPSAVSVAGCSFGGIHSILAAERIEGVHAAVSFAGAAMSWQGSPAMRERLLSAVAHARAPIFFVQAENDYDTTPSQVLSAAMRASHLPVAMRVFPPHGTTPSQGHAHFCNFGQGEWGDDVLAFLRDPSSRAHVD